MTSWGAVFALLLPLLLLLLLLVEWIMLIMLMQGCGAVAEAAAVVLSSSKADEARTLILASAESSSDAGRAVLAPRGTAVEALVAAAVAVVTPVDGAQLQSIVTRAATSLLVAVLAAMAGRDVRGCG